MTSTNRSKVNHVYQPNVCHLAELLKSSVSLLLGRATLSHVNTKK